MKNKANKTSFKKGMIPWNKGKLNPWAKNLPQQFKKGHPKPKNAYSWQKGHLGFLNSGSFKNGKKHPNWKGGINPEYKKIRRSIQFRLWREAVFARDNWICQKHGIKGGKLCPHHIQNFAQYPELRFAIDNGMTLSDKAHKEFHKKYGLRNNTKEQIEEFLYE